MKTYIFIRSTLLLTGLLFTVACQNAKLDKKSPQSPQPANPQGPTYPPQGGPQQGGGQPRPSQPVVYPPPVDRSQPTEYRPVDLTPPKETPRTGGQPVILPRQKGAASPVRSQPQIIPWFENPGPNPKYIQNCGPKCPPSQEPVIVAPTPAPAPTPTPAPDDYQLDCSVNMIMDGGGQAGTPEAYPPVEMGNPARNPVRGPQSVGAAVVVETANRTPQNEPIEIKSDYQNKGATQKPAQIGEPIEMGTGAPMTKMKRSREGDQEQLICPDVNLRKRDGVKLDLIFVVDNSDSMLVEKNKIAAGMRQFAENIGGEKDLRIAVVSANGPQGQKFAEVVGQVIDFKDLERRMGREAAVASLTQQLQQYMNHMPVDKSDAQGEVGLAATYALVTSHLQRAKSQGLFRDDAALMVVYVSDENDACYDYAKTGARPNYLYPNDDVGAQGRPNPDDNVPRDPFEYKTFISSVCKNVGGPGIHMGPELVYQALRNVKGSQPIILSGILYHQETLPGEMITGATGPYRYEKEKGRGYLDLIGRHDLNGSKAFELNSPNFGSHLAQLAGLARSRMDNETEIVMVLPAGVTPNPTSIYVDVRSTQGVKRYSVECAVARANCAPGVEPARYVFENGKHKVLLTAEVAAQLKNGGKAYLHYRKQQ